IKFNAQKLILMTQVGIADSFPLFYKNMEPLQKKQLIRNKIELMCKSLIQNSRNICSSIGYAYANQSKFNSDILDSLGLNFDPYDLRKEIIKNFSNSIIQLNPSDQIIDGNYKKFTEKKETLMQHRLENLKKSFLNYSASKNLEILPINFLTMEKQSYKQDQINIFAKDNVWNDILSGVCNLEAIITGGLGLIEKPSDYNMRKEYLLLSNWAYIHQKKAQNDLTCAF
ncbi:hypothetical protein OA387_04635, partial [Prochlorococcus sp. AH-716-M10]|nr:hypothetical protein [Prochlorococcus sp. AH-716-M10]